MNELISLRNSTNSKIQEDKNFFPPKKWLMYQSNPYANKVLDIQVYNSNYVFKKFMVYQLAGWG